MQIDVYEDCILLMDEQQMAENKNLLLSHLGKLQQHEWVFMIMPISGSMEIEIGDETYHCSVGKLMLSILRDGFVIQQFSHDFAARTIGMNIHFSDGLNLPQTLNSLLAIQRQPVIDISAEIQHTITLIFDQLRGLIRATDNPYQFRAIQTIVEFYYYSIGYYLYRHTDVRRHTRSEALTDQFLQLAKRDFRKHREIEHYASALYVSKKHLSSTVTKITGKPASFWIEQNVVRFAKQQLVHSSLNVAEIANELNFANPSHFGTYFKRATGVSPQTYRKREQRVNQ